MNTTTHPAEVIFIERAAGGAWDARFLSTEGLTGLILGRPAGAKSTILTLREQPDGSIEWKTPGETTHNGNRHNWAPNITAAQDAVIKWAGRRFRV